jgi:hypothetical protein
MIYSDTLAEYVRFHKMKTIEVTQSTSLKDFVTLANQEREVVLTQDNKPVAEGLTVVTDDRAFTRYNIPVIW